MDGDRVASSESMPAKSKTKTASRRTRPAEAPADEAVGNAAREQLEEEFVPFRLAVVANRLSQSVGRVFEKEFNIQVPEWRILTSIEAHRRLSFFEVVDKTGMDKARVSRAYKRLVDLGLVISASDPDDGRKIILALTAKGRSLCKAIIPEARRTEERFLQALTPDERNSLTVILQKLFDRSEELRTA